MCLSPCSVGSPLACPSGLHSLSASLGCCRMNGEGLGPAQVQARQRHQQTWLHCRSLGEICSARDLDPLPGSSLLQALHLASQGYCYTQFRPSLVLKNKNAPSEEAYLDIGAKHYLAHAHFPFPSQLRSFFPLLPGISPPRVCRWSACALQCFSYNYLGF